jgi:hypothetical protein
VFGQGEENETTLFAGDPEYPSDDVVWTYFAKYRSGGELEWAKSLNTDSSPSYLGYFPKLAMFDSDDGQQIALVGGGSPTFEMGEENETILEEQDWMMGLPVFMARYEADGVFKSAQWLLSLDGECRLEKIASVDGKRLAVAGNAWDRVTFSGPKEDPIDVRGAGYDVFLAMYNLDSGYQWHTKMWSGYDDYLDDIAVVDSSIVVGGTFACAIGGYSNNSSYDHNLLFFGEEKDETNALRTQGGCDAFIASYSLDGTWQWARREGGSGSDWLAKIAAGDDNSLIVSGVFQKKVVLGACGENETTLKSEGDWDMFMMKLAVY